MSAEDLVHRLRKRADIRRQISTRKSVQEGRPDRLADLLEEAAKEIESYQQTPFVTPGFAIGIIDAVAEVLLRRQVLECWKQGLLTSQEVVNAVSDSVYALLERHERLWPFWRALSKMPPVAPGELKQGSEVAVERRRAAEKWLQEHPTEPGVLAWHQDKETK